MKQPVCVETKLSLVGGFRLQRRGVPLRLPRGACRLLGYLALRENGASRSAISEALWPGRHSGRAAANLRTAVWQARTDEPALISVAGDRLRLATVVRVDLPEMLTSAREVLTAGGSFPVGHEDVIGGLSRELLPDWPDGWLLFERERWDQVRLHALEALAHQLAEHGWFVPALEAALIAVAVEPVRESANRTLIEVHLAEGNLACAIKHYRQYCSLLEDELGVAPSPMMEQLLRPHVAR